MSDVTILNGLRIRTEFTQPPMPDRNFDWSAWIDGRENIIGRGKTELDAVAELLQTLDERDNLEDVMELTNKQDEQPTNAECYYAVYKPTLWERFGFKRCGAPEMPDEEFPDMPVSRMVSTVVIHLDWLDRLRALLSGNICISTSHKTDVMVETCISRSNVSVMKPWSVRREK